MGADALKFHGALHQSHGHGTCQECGQPFPCPTGLAIYEAVKREHEHPTPPPPPLPPIVQPAPVRWEDLPDRGARCPRCRHWWVSLGVPTEAGYGCGIRVALSSLISGGRQLSAPGRRRDTA